MKLFHQVIADVVEHDSFNRFHRLRLRAPEIADKALPGQFICVYIDDEFEKRFVMPRPFSISDANGEEIEIVFAVVGAGTAWMANLRVGDALRILGPLGKPFTWLDGCDVALLVGGGIGFAPLPFLAKVLKGKGVDVVAFFGAKSASEMPFKTAHEHGLRIQGAGLSVREVARWGVPSAIALEQSYEGTFHGSAVDLALRWLEANQDRKVALYACGPREMLRRLQSIMIERSIVGQFSVEERMACGLGLCFGCACKVIEDGVERYKMVCVDGPVFDAHKLIL
jgi:dihydroorotate dehydrogenase electron transfer subunit